GAVRLVGGEYGPFSERLASAEGGEAHHARVGLLLYGDAPFLDHREEAAWMAFLEDEAVLIEGGALHRGGESIQIGLREALEEGVAREVGALIGDGHGTEKLHLGHHWRQREHAGYSAECRRCKLNLSASRWSSSTWWRAPGASSGYCEG